MYPIKKRPWTGITNLPRRSFPRPATSSIRRLFRQPTKHVSYLMTSEQFSTSSGGSSQPWLCSADSGANRTEAHRAARPAGRGSTPRFCSTPKSRGTCSSPPLRIRLSRAAGKAPSKWGQTTWGRRDSGDFRILGSRRGKTQEQKPEKIHMKNVPCCVWWNLTVWALNTRRSWISTKSLTI